jgi:hypothetical protein
MRARLRAEGLESRERFRDIMMDAVAETGRNSDVVGEDVIGVILEPLGRKIRVHFRTADPVSQAELAGAGAVPQDRARRVRARASVTDVLAVMQRGQGLIERFDQAGQRIPLWCCPLRDAPVAPQTDRTQRGQHRCLTVEQRGAAVPAQAVTE